MSRLHTLWSPNLNMAFFCFCFCFLFLSRLWSLFMCTHHYWAFISRENPESFNILKKLLRKAKMNPLCVVRQVSKMPTLPWLNALTQLQAYDFMASQCMVSRQLEWRRQMMSSKITRYICFMWTYSSFRSRPFAPNGLFRAAWDITLLIIITCSTSCYNVPSLPPSWWSKIVHITLSQMLKAELCVLWCFWHRFISPVLPSFFQTWWNHNDS